MRRDRTALLLTPQYKTPKNTSPVTGRKRSYMQSDNINVSEGFDYDEFLGEPFGNWSLQENVLSHPNFTFTFPAMSENSSLNFSDPAAPTKSPAIGVLLAMFSLITVVGNVMVIVAVARELYLRTVTNYLIVSLAVADVMVGGIVMPFSISLEMTSDYWEYGQAWCDLWHSFDVLASTASILNLCVISLDRYWAITNPIAYPNNMSNQRVCLLIALVWATSSGISFPAIFWWRQSQTSFKPYTCEFTSDGVYLIISSCLSFYVPTVIMFFVYVRIFRTALAQTQGIKAGMKVTADCSRGNRGEMMTLRIHKGGYRMQNDTSPSSGSVLEQQQNQRRSSDESGGESPLSGRKLSPSQCRNGQNNHLQAPQPRPSKLVSKKIRHFVLSKKISKVAREQKAAKTLGIVVGVFTLCWLPFFCMNVLLGICGFGCLYKPEILFKVFTWLGYINSGMNPVIYALSMRDFRRAFSKMIFCCPRYRYTPKKQNTYHYTHSTSTSSFNVTHCTDIAPLRR